MAIQLYLGRTRKEEGWQRSARSSGSRSYADSSSPMLLPPPPPLSPLSMRNGARRRCAARRRGRGRLILCRQQRVGARRALTRAGALRARSSIGTHQITCMWLENLHNRLVDEGRERGGGAGRRGRRARRKRRGGKERSNSWPPRNRASFGAAAPPPPTRTAKQSNQACVSHSQRGGIHPAVSAQRVHTTHVNGFA